MNSFARYTAWTGLFAASAVAGCGAGSHDHPVAIVEDPVRHLGTVTPGEEQRIIFEIRNAGRSPLRLSDLTTSCGCSPAELESDVVPAGESTRLIVRTEAPHYQGRFARSVTFSTNDPERPDHALRFDADARWDAVADPSNVYLGRIGSEGEREHQFTVYSPTGSRFKVEEIDATADCIDVVEVDSSPTERVYAVKVDPTKVQGEISETVRLTTDLESRKHIFVQLTGYAKSLPACEPDRVILGPRLPNSTTSLELAVKTRGSAGVDPEIGVPAFSRKDWKVRSHRLDHSESEPGLVNLGVTVELPEAAGYHRASLSLETLDGSLEVPVSCYIEH